MFSWIICLIFRLVLVLIASFRVDAHNEAHVPITQVREYWFFISWFDISPAGFQRPMLGVNNQFPGPTIRGNVGDLLRVHVINNIQTRENTSIHWHGLHQRRTPWDDGPEQVTQCPIVFGATHAYEFQLMESGTHWYHSHHAEQFADGLWGVIIVDNQPEVWGHLYEGEVTITLTDHYLATGEAISNWYYSPINPAADASVPYSILINGQGYYPCEYAELQGIPCLQKPEAPTVIEVKEGIAYRIRVVCSSSARILYFSIDDHKLETIEADGVDTQLGGHIDEAELSSGMRYSFIVNMTAGRVGSEFYIRVDSSSPESPPIDINPFPEAYMTPALAILRYVENPDRPTQPLVDQQPKSQENREPVSLIENQHCLPYGNRMAPDYFDEEISVSFARGTTADGNPYFTTNNQKYALVHGQPPNLLQVFWNQTLPDYSIPLRTSGNGKVVQLVVNNRHHRSHPIHLHGHSFWVVGVGASGEGDYNASEHSNRLKTNVVLRDTTRFEGNSWLILRYIADNPGVWLLHCHVNWHIPGGMAAVIVEGEDLLHQNFNVPSETLRVCKAAGITPPALSDEVTESHSSWSQPLVMSLFLCIYLTAFM